MSNTGFEFLRKSIEFDRAVFKIHWAIVNAWERISEKQPLKENLFTQKQETPEKQLSGVENGC